MSVEPAVLWAINVAVAVHTRQVDKSSLPYLGHVARVAARCTTPDEITVAWLHDVVEDALLLSYLREQGWFSERVLTAVDAISRREDEPYRDYLHRVRANPLALAVKLADLDDNTDPDRDGALTSSMRKRYAEARAFLAGP